ncbi:unnamed protein product [Prorocentrum cordatum]|uniref:HNH nuclease domain-containing protein n=1 Tax=Prorocentrum cordatum TaxID=2364126 RepID=A0ABN9WYX7_9DINO|nr:unnamed protein product [Polarella glacialis]
MCCKGRMISAKGYEFRFGAPIGPPCLPGEEWRPALHPCTGRELSTWEVSSHGRMKSTRGLVSYGSRTLAGYRATGISTDGRQTKHLVHRLVARAFLWQPSYAEDLVVNHIDGNKENNSIGNLEYVNRSQKALLSKKLWFGCSSSGVTRSKPVWARIVGSESWNWYASMTEAARLLRLTVGNISLCCRGITRRASSYDSSLQIRPSPACCQERCGAGSRSACSRKSREYPSPLAASHAQIVLQYASSRPPRSCLLICFAALLAAAAPSPAWAHPLASRAL